MSPTVNRPLARWSLPAELRVQVFKEIIGNDPTQLIAFGDSPSRLAGMGDFTSDRHFMKPPVYNSISVNRTPRIFSSIDCRDFESELLETLSSQSLTFTMDLQNRRPKSEPLLDSFNERDLYLCVPSPPTLGRGTFATPYIGSHEFPGYRSQTLIGVLIGAAIAAKRFPSRSNYTISAEPPYMEMLKWGTLHYIWDVLRYRLGACFETFRPILAQMAKFLEVARLRLKACTNDSAIHVHLSVDDCTDKQELLALVRDLRQYTDYDEISIKVIAKCDGEYVTPALKEKIDDMRGKLDWEFLAEGEEFGDEEAVMMACFGP